MPEKFLKPDAFVLASLKGSKYVTAFWVEVDLGSEPIWRVRDKVKLYAQFKKSNQLGPRGIMPAILVTTHTERRRDAIRRAIDTNVWGHKEQWQGGGEIFLSEALNVRVESFDDAVAAIIKQLPA